MAHREKFEGGNPKKKLERNRREALKQISPVFKYIDADRIQNTIDKICFFASEWIDTARRKREVMGGIISEGGSRLAFSEADFRLRQEIQTWIEIMLADHCQVSEPKSIDYASTAKIITFEYEVEGEEIPRQVIIEQNAAGIRVKFLGTDPSLRSVAFGSHLDTILRGGREDGQDGLASSLEIFEAVLQSGIRPQRTLEIAFVTGEESGLVSFSGSQLLARGIDKDALDTIIEASFTLRQGIEAWEDWFAIRNNLTAEELGQHDIDQLYVDKPIMGDERWFLHVELHSDPTNYLKQVQENSSKKFVAGAAKEIMGAERTLPSFRLSDGEVIEPKELKAELTRAVTITFDGSSGHTGMSMQQRNFQASGVHDALIPAANFILDLTSQSCLDGVYLSNFKIEDQAINKIPQKVSFILVLTGRTRAELDDLEKRIRQKLKKSPTTPQSFKPNLSIQNKSNPKCSLISLEKSKQTWMQICTLILATRELALKYDLTYSNTVATISTFQLNNREIKLGMDMRGVDYRVRSGLLIHLLMTFAKKVVRVLEAPLDLSELESSYCTLMQTNTQQICPILNTEEEEKVSRFISLFNNLDLGLYVPPPLPGSEKPLSINANLVEDLIEVGQKVGVRVERMTIRAGEDCLVLRDKADNICMVFVVSNGQCHNLHECVESQDLENATLVKLMLILKYGNMTNLEQN